MTHISQFAVKDFDANENSNELKEYQVEVITFDGESEMVYVEAYNEDEASNIAAARVGNADYTMFTLTTKQDFFPERRSAKRLTFFLLSPPTGTAECILIIRLPPLRCVCEIAALPSRSLSARFRPAWLIVAVVGTFVLRKLADFHC